jgi:hypothetical protein
LAVHSTGDLTLQETTVSGRVASVDEGSGGVVNVGGTVTLTNSTITGNSTRSLYGGGYGAGGVALARTLVAGNNAVISSPEVIRLPFHRDDVAHLAIRKILCLPMPGKEDKDVVFVLCLGFQIVAEDP